jgi:hypothetical protein
MCEALVVAAHVPAPPGSRQRQRENGSWVLVVPDEYWVSETETHRLLGGGRLRLVNAAQHERIMHVENAAHEPGFLRSTVEREAQWWARTPRWGRFLRVLTDNGP